MHHQKYRDFLDKFKQRAGRNHSQTVQAPVYCVPLREQLIRTREFFSPEVVPERNLTELEGLLRVSKLTFENSLAKSKNESEMIFVEEQLPDPFSGNATLVQPNFDINSLASDNTPPKPSTRVLPSPKNLKSSELLTTL